MAIPDEDVAQVRASTDIVALIGEHAALRQAGRRWVGLCPFHAEKTPSFSVNAQEGFYYCFGCQASGDAISFVRATEHLDFVDAVRLLADRAGVVIHEDAAAGADRKRRTELLDAMERAVDWYHRRLLSAPDAGRARDYLRSRGYDGATVRKFRLGWAPDDWDALAKALKLSERVLTDSALGFVNRRGRAQDAFRGRIIFPICDPSGRPVALGGRILPEPPPPTGDRGAGDQRGGSGGDGGGGDRRPEPKYKNSSETAIYSKRRTLYALNWAKHDIVATGEVVVCEGYTDVIGCFTSGIPRAVATCGTALAEEHFKLLRNFGQRIVLAYDADSAGQSAISRVYEWERQQEVNVAVAALPPGSDPGELARTDPEALRRAIAEARPFLQFRVDRVLAAADLETAEGRARAAEEALVAVAEHPDGLVRDQYVMQLADRCRLEPALLRERLEEVRRRPPPPQPTNRREGAGGGGARGDDRRDGARGHGEPAGGDAAHGDQGEGDPGWNDRGQGDGRWADDGPDGRPAPGARRVAGGNRSLASARPGLEALRLAVHRPEAVADRLEEVLFVDELQRRAFVALVEADSLQQAVDSADPEAAELLRRLVVEEPLISENPLADPVESVITQLVREAARRALVGLQAAVRTSSGNLGAMATETVMVRRWLEELDDPASGREASDRLLAWLLGGWQEGR
ncbi:MAG TPA: CHC2 zinc finger domain-containing protein [Acidimicrobiales bacterium]|nr:CHC2 zinc finger domain-containing protein [Acidimicrobiales bacterium]